VGLPVVAEVNCMRTWFFGAMRFVVGGSLAVLSIFACLQIWMFFFDSDGGEPGSNTIFSILFLWPVFLLLIFGLAVTSAVSARVTRVLAVLTGVVVVGALLTIMVLRARNGVL